MGLETVYKIAFVYKITSGTQVYFGSTKDFSRRKIQHINAYENYIKNGGRYYQSFDILKLGDYTFEIIETHNIISKFDLLMREKFYIDNNDCINNRAPINTVDELKQQKQAREKRYRQKHDVDLKAKKNEKFNCPCGGKYTKSHKALHDRSIKHIKYITNVKTINISSLTINIS